MYHVLPDPNGTERPPLDHSLANCHHCSRKEEPLKREREDDRRALRSSIIELERERAETDRHHREALATAHQRAAEELAMALEAQKERLEQEHASAIDAAISAFQESQRQYFVEAEAAVVRLALSIAERVSAPGSADGSVAAGGAVRVAIEDVQQSTTCVLEVARREDGGLGPLARGGGQLARVQIRGKDDAGSGALPAGNRRKHR